MSGDHEIALTPGPVGQVLWDVSGTFRLLVRLVLMLVPGARWVALGWAVLRVAAHKAMANPHWMLAAWAGLQTRLTVAVVLGLVVEAVVRFVPHRWVTWFRMRRAGWRLHSVWPRMWTEAAARTRQVQGTDHSRNGETRASAIRPLADHPRMPLRFWIRGNVITFRLGVPVGRSFVELERVLAPVAGNISWIHAMHLEYATDQSSYGLLHVELTDALDTPERPSWSRPDDNVIDFESRRRGGAA